MFGPQHRALRVQLEQSRAMARDAGLGDGRTQDDGDRPRKDRPTGGGPRPPPASRPPDRRTALKQRALEDSGVQAMLDVFGAEIKDVEEM